VPGLAFDKKGRRIGSGKGFYDIFLEKIKGQAGIIGLGYDFQILPEIPNELHDVCMDKIITEKRII
jgi:5-formyltetrahydrofolate cyclo-ligase